MINNIYFHTNVEGTDLISLEVMYHIRLTLDQVTQWEINSQMTK